MININQNLDTKKEKLEFLDLYELYLKLDDDNRMFVFGLAMGLQFNTTTKKQEEENAK